MQSTIFSGRVRDDPPTDFNSPFTGNQNRSRPWRHKIRVPFTVWRRLELSIPRPDVLRPSVVENWTLGGTQFDFHAAAYATAFSKGAKRAQLANFKIRLSFRLHQSQDRHGHSAWKFGKDCCSPPNAGVGRNEAAGTVSATLRGGTDGVALAEGGAGRNAAGQLDRGSAILTPFHDRRGGRPGFRASSPAWP